MAFARANFSPVGSTSARGKAPCIWSYKTADTHATVDGAGYFNLISDILSIGDIIQVVVVTNLGASNEATSTYGTHLVNANASGVVDVSNVTVGTVTDSD